MTSSSSGILRSTPPTALLLSKGVSPRNLLFSFLLTSNHFFGDSSTAINHVARRYGVLDLLFLPFFCLKFPLIF